MNTALLFTAPYKLYRVPLAVLDHQAAQRLRVDSAPRLALSRALGSYDRLAGRMLGDDDIAEQGRDRIARSEKLARAAALGRDAADRREQATQTTESGRRNAAAKRQHAKQQLTDGLDAANATERMGKQHAATRARSQANDATKQAKAVTTRRDSRTGD